MATKEFYPHVRNKPVARFYYKGTHSHPVRRTILVTEVTPKLIRGYELRNGSTIRTFTSAPIRSFRRDRIATGEQLRGEVRRKMSKKQRTISTLERAELFDLVKTGV